MPNIETRFKNMHGAKYFAKIDLKSAYWQIELDQESQEICNINTSKGLYRVTRLQMGMKNASFIFQEVMEKILQGLTGILVWHDEISIWLPPQNLWKSELMQ
eukprot:Pompholyxophrys_punicea_v1_NODE_227_length_2683_cov_13.396650.p6 type:complete len:102 gc:universal NODE_227_length_2683_cov_13.396650:1724-1419(-)